MHSKGGATILEQNKDPGMSLLSVIEVLWLNSLEAKEKYFSRSLITETSCTCILFQVIVYF